MEDLIVGNQAINEKQASDMQKIEYKRKKEAFKAQKQDLIERTADLINTYGPENEYAEILMEIIDVVQEMENVMAVLEGMQAGFEAVFSCMGLMDDMMISITDLFTQSNQVNYGFMANLKRKQQMKKTMQNIEGRFNQMSERLIQMKQIAGMLKKTMGNVSKKMNKGKKNGANQSSVSSSTMALVMAEAARKRGEAPSDPSLFDTSSSSSNSSSSSSDNPFGGNDGF